MNENEKNLPEEEIVEESLDTEIEELDSDEAEEEAYTDEDDDTEESEEEESEEGEESDPVVEEKPTTEPEPHKTEEPKKAEPLKDKQYKRLIRDTRRALEGLGIKLGSDEDVVDEIVKLAAEQKGKSVEEYKKDSDEEDEFLEYKRQKDEEAKTAEKLKWEEQFKKDLEDIHTEFPEAKKYTHFTQFPNARRFAELMETGRVSAVEAFKLSHPDEAVAKIVAGVKQASLNDTKAHLHSSRPKPASSGAVHISKSEMDTYRDMFPDLSDAEIRKYHAKVTKN